jgi:hypothetical protein
MAAPESSIITRVAYGVSQLRIDAIASNDQLRAD